MNRTLNEIDQDIDRLTAKVQTALAAAAPDHQLLANLHAHLSAMWAERGKSGGEGAFGPVPKT